MVEVVALVAAAANAAILLVVVRTVVIVLHLEEIEDRADEKWIQLSLACIVVVVVVAGCAKSGFSELICLPWRVRT